MVSNLIDSKMVAGQRFAARLARWPAVAFLAAASSFYTVNYTRNWWNDLTGRLGWTVNAFDGSDLIVNGKKQPPWWRRLPWKRAQEQPALPVDVMNEELKKYQFSNDMQTGSVARFDTNQYSANDPIEDRHIECHFPSSNAIMFAVFDGHSGYHCSETLRKRMPQYLSPALAKASNNTESISDNLSNYTIIGTEHLDNPDLEMPVSLAKKQAKLRTGPAAFSNHLLNLKTKFTYSDAMREAFNLLDKDICNEAIPDGVGDNTLMVGLAGSCAIVSVVQGDNLYIANTGDCRAVIGKRSASGAWVASQVTQDQTVDNPVEVQRIEGEHPNEQKTAIQRGRLLGQLQPLRSFGDVQYKWSRDLHERVINVVYGRPVVPPYSYLTPPYLTAEPVVSHRKITEEDKFMIIATDGLWEKISSENAVELIGLHLDATRVASGKEQELTAENGSTLLIKFALGQGSDIVLANMLTLPEQYKRHFHDDITVTVVYFSKTSVNSKL